MLPFGRKNNELDDMFIGDWVTDGILSGISLKVMTPFGFVAELTSI